jgi:hypothetical protein
LRFYPAAALEGGEALTLCVGPSGLKFGPPPGFRAVGEALQTPPGSSAAAPELAAAATGAAATKAARTAALKAAADAEDAAQIAAAAVAAAKRAAAAPRPVEPLALDLSRYGDAASLEALGLDRLKAALLALKAKVGGTLQQRAERLWAFKALKPGEAADPALLAAPPPQKPKQ